MPCSSRARRRSERVRGLIPSSERSSSQKRRLPSARSRITKRVHLPEMISEVRQTGHLALLIALMEAEVTGGTSPRFSEYSGKASETEAWSRGSVAVRPLAALAAGRGKIAACDLLELDQLEPVG